MNTNKCEDCGRCGLESEFKYISACADGKLGTYSCCEKRVCANGCSFTLKCGHTWTSLNTDTETDSVFVQCDKCDTNETIHLIWRGITNVEWEKRYG